MIIAAIVCLDKARFILPTSILSASMVPFAACYFPMQAARLVVPKKLFLTLDNHLYSAYMRLCSFIFESVSGTRIHFYGDYSKLCAVQESALVISNHQSNVDWAIVNMLACRQSPTGMEFGLRFVLKHAISFVPLFGWYVLQHGYVYVRRFGAFVPEPLLRQFAHLKTLGEPFWLHVFPEGTRFSGKKPQAIAASTEFANQRGLPVPQHTLMPRAGAFALALTELRESLDCVYDVTIAYGYTRLPDRARRAPNMFEFVSGPSEGKEVHIHVRRVPISELPQSRPEVQQWLFRSFAEKDGMLANFHESGVLPELVQQDAPKLPFLRTFLPFAFFTGAIALPFYSETARSVYLYTLASAPFLTAWIHLTKCV